MNQPFPAGRTRRRDHGYMLRMDNNVPIRVDFVGQQENAHREDMKMVSTITRTMNRPFRIPPRNTSSSLDFEKRRRDYERIVAGNHRLLERIKSAKSVYTRNRYNADYIVNQKYALNCSFSLRKWCESFLRADAC